MDARRTVAERKIDASDQDRIVCRSSSGWCEIGMGGQNGYPVVRSNVVQVLLYTYGVLRAAVESDLLALLRRGSSDSGHLNKDA